MTRELMICLAGLGLVLFIAGCGQGGVGASGQSAEKMGKCPTCGKAAPIGTYCGKCTAVTSAGGTVHCDKCNKDFKAGQYCPKCNAFMFKETMPCAKCGKDMKRGAWCGKCKAYSGVPNATFDEKTGKPCSRTEAY